MKLPAKEIAEAPRVKKSSRAEGQPDKQPDQVLSQTIPSHNHNGSADHITTPVPNAADMRHPVRNHTGFPLKLIQVALMVRLASDGSQDSPDVLSMPMPFVYRARAPIQFRSLVSQFYPPRPPQAQTLLPPSPALSMQSYAMARVLPPDYMRSVPAPINYYTTGVNFQPMSIAQIYPRQPGMQLEQAFLTAPALAVPMPAPVAPQPAENPPRPGAGSGVRPADLSVDSLDDSPRNQSLLRGKAYKCRNVYKSVVRHLFSYIRKNREDIMRILTEAGFTTQEIEHGFFKINYYNDLEREQSKKKNSQSTIKKMVAKRTIYTYILRETLNTMLHNWDIGKFGKVSEGNSAVYKDVCKYFYEETVKVLGQPAQGRTFLL